MTFSSASSYVPTPLSSQLWIHPLPLFFPSYHRPSATCTKGNRPKWGTFFSRIMFLDSKGRDWRLGVERYHIFPQIICPLFLRQYNFPSLGLFPGVWALPGVNYAPVIGAPPSSGGGSHRMVTTLGWASADPGTRCGLPGGHGGTVTQSCSQYEHLDRQDKAH